jgi:hypothetical protein
LGTLRVPTGAKGLMRLWRGSTRPLEPSWHDTPYGQVSSGLWLEAYRAWKKHRRLVHLWAVWHYGLGMLAVALAGLAGFGGLSQLLGYQAAAWIAIGSGIATGLVVFLKSNEKRQQHEGLAASWDNLLSDVTTLYITRPGADPQQAAGTAESDPAGSSAVGTALEERAKILRTGKATSEPPVAWPPTTVPTAGEGQEHTDQADAPGA